MVTLVVDSEGYAWIEKNGGVVPEDGAYLEFQDLTECKIFKFYPNRSSACAVLFSRQLIELIWNDNDAVTIFQYTEWGVSPDEEYPPLLHLVRQGKGLGENALWNQQGQLISSDETEFATCIVMLSLLFLWNLVIFNPEKKLIINISHDEWIEFIYRSEDPDDELWRGLRSLAETYSISKKEFDE